MASALKIKPVKPLHVGLIPYWNLRPLFDELRRQGPDDFVFHSGSPALINNWLGEGKITLAPCSSVCLLKNSELDLAFPLGVAAKGPVQSVYIGFHRDGLPVYERIMARQAQLKSIVRDAMKRHSDNPRRLAEVIWETADRYPATNAPLPTLSLTPASATSATLTRVLSRLWFGTRLQEITQKPDVKMDSHIGDTPVMELLIGDEALIRRPSYAAVIDLSEAWYDLTSLPFVFAVWQKTHGTLAPYWRKRISDAAELAQARMRVDPKMYLPDGDPSDMIGHRIDLTSYWKTITYQLGDSHMRGLLLFLCLARQLAPAKFGQDFTARVLRWDAMRADEARGG